MIRLSFRLNSVLSVALAVLLAGGCRADPMAPSDSAGTILLAVQSGNTQSGVVGTELTQPLVVKATNSKGNPISGLSVNFRVVNGGGSVYAGSTITDAKGVAADYWTLGTSTTQPQRVEVRSVDAAAVKTLHGVFSATPLPGPPVGLAQVAGDQQWGPAGIQTRIAPAAKVTDQYGNLVPGVTVDYSTLTGSLTGPSPVTDAAGVATVGSWTLALGGNLLLAQVRTVPAITLSFSATGAAPNTWSIRAPMPTARASLGVTSANGIVYAIGGSPATGGASMAVVEAYDPATNSWSSRAQLPTGRQGLGAATVNGIIYAIGGSDRNGVPLATVEAYNPVTNLWSTRASLPTARASMGVTTVNGIVYVIGGGDSFSLLASVEAYDPATDTWSTKAPLSGPRAYIGVTAANGLVYAMGGLDLTGKPQATLEAYNPVANAWSTKASLSVERYLAGAAAVNGVVFAIAGFGENAGHDTAEAYDPATNTWSTKASLVTYRYGMGATTVNGIVYAIGGWDQ